MFKKGMVVLALVIALPFLSGCAIGVLAAGVGYAVGQGRQGTAKVMEAKSKYLDRYNTYKIEMEKINLEREKSGLALQPIDEFEVWLQKQPLTPEEMKLFQHYKAQTPNEIKENEVNSHDKKKEQTVPNTSNTNNFTK